MRTGNLPDVDEQPAANREENEVRRVVVKEVQKHDKFHDGGDS